MSIVVTVGQGPLARARGNSGSSGALRHCAMGRGHDTAGALDARCIGGWSRAWRDPIRDHD